MGNGRERLSGTGADARKTKSQVTQGCNRWIPLAASCLLLLSASAMVGIRPHHFLRSSNATQSARLPIPTLAGHASSRSKVNPDARTLLGQLPLIFEPNQGQASEGVKFVSRGSGYSLFLDQGGAILATPAPRQSSSAQTKPQLELLRMALAGANQSAVVVGSDPLPGKTNYFIGNDAKKWHTGVPQFAGVRYQNVYPGIDLVFYGKQGRLEYDFKIAPGADPAQAELQFDGPAKDGPTKLELNGGDLVFKRTGADVRLQAPRIYQAVAGQQKTIEGRFVLRAANRVGFEIGPYDRSRELVIDPTITYATFFGGNATETAPSIAVNGNGNIYLAGSTTSTTGIVPTGATPLQATLVGTQNIFIAELNPSLGAAGLLAVTYLGGSGSDSVGCGCGPSAALAVDSAGNAYVAGTTTSPNFPATSAAYQTTPLAGSTGASHVFVTVLAPGFAAGSLLYSTYLSGNGTDIASGLAIDGKGDAFITGTTTSTNQGSISPPVVFPASYFPPPFQPTSKGPVQFFVTEVDTRGTGTSSVPYSTYFGGTNGTIATGGGIAVDSTGNVYFSGTTNFFNSGEGTNGTGGLQGSDFPIVNAYQPCLDTPPPTTITYPVTCATPPSPVPTDGFVAKINPANAQTGASQLLFSTYLGGTNNDSAPALTIDTTASSIYITGSTNSTDFNILTGVGEFQPCLNVPAPSITCVGDTTHTDAYVAKFSNPTEASGSTVTATAVTLSYFSYLGGSLNDSGLAIAVDTGGGALITGATSSIDFPVFSTMGSVPIQSTLKGAQNAFFAHIDTTTISGTSEVGSYATYYGGSGTDRGTSITVDTNLNTYFAGDTTSADFQTQGGYQSTLGGTMDAFAVVLRPANDLCVTCIAPVLSPGSGVIGAGNPITITFTVSNNGPDLATNITASAQISSSTAASFTSVSAGSGSNCSTPSGTTATCLIPSLQAGSTATVTVGLTPTTAGSGQVILTATNANNTGTNISTTAPFTATGYSVSISPSSQTEPAGTSAIYSVLVQPSQTYGNNVALTCGSLPAGASCGFSQSTLTFNGPGAQSSLLTLTTTARPITTISSTGWRGPLYAIWLLAPGLALFGAGGKGRRGRWLALLALLTLFAFIAPLPGCSKAKQQPTTSGTPAGNYTLTVTATSGSYTQTAGFNLTVQ